MHISAGADPQRAEGQQGDSAWPEDRDGDVVAHQEEHKWKANLCSAQSKRLMWHSSHCFYCSGKVASHRSHQVQGS